MEGEKWTTSIGSAVFLIPIMFLAPCWKIMFPSWFFTIVLYYCQGSKKEETRKGIIIIKKRKLCPWEGDNYFNRAHNRNPQASPCIDRPETTTHRYRHTQYPAGLPATAQSPSKRTEVFKLPLSYPNYLLLVINWHHCSLLQDPTLGCQEGLCRG